MAEKGKRKSKYIFLILRIAVVAAGIVWAIWWVRQGQRWENLAQIFGRMNLWVFAGTLGIFIVGQIIVGLRWWMLLRTQSIFIEFWAAVKLHFLGLFYNNVMPSSVGGDLIRAWYVTKHTDKRFEAALSVFVDRIIGLISTLIIAGFFYFLFLRGVGTVITSGEQSADGILKSIADYGPIFLWAIVAVAVVFCVLSLHRRGRVILKKVWSRISAYGTKMIKKLADAMVIYCSKPLIILTAFGLTVFLQIMTITGFWFLGMSLGIEAGVKYYYVFFTLTWMLGAVPVSIGGAVVVEGLLAYLFINITGVVPEAALALALCQRVVWILASLPGVVIHLTGVHLPKDFSIDYNKPMN